MTEVLTVQDVAMADHRTIAQGERITLAAARLGLTIAALGREVGLEQPNIARIVAGKRPGRKHIQKIATRLGVPVEWITTGHPRQPWETDSGAGQPLPDEDAEKARLKALVAQLAAEVAAREAELQALRKVNRP